MAAAALAASDPSDLAAKAASGRSSGGESCHFRGGGGGDSGGGNNSSNSGGSSSGSCGRHGASVGDAACVSVRPAAAFPRPVLSSPTMTTRMDSAAAAANEIAGAAAPGAAAGSGLRGHAPLNYYEIRVKRAGEGEPGGGGKRQMAPIGTKATVSALTAPAEATGAGSAAAGAWAAAADAERCACRGEDSRSCRRSGNSCRGSKGGAGFCESRHQGRYGASRQGPVRLGVDAGIRRHSSTGHEAAGRRKRGTCALCDAFI
ncbi:unnamed protein product, partial [Phaeothamnion confervicola]